MKRYLILFFVLTLCAGAGITLAAPAPWITVFTVKGSVSYSDTGKDDWNPVYLSRIFLGGESVRTGEASAARIITEDGMEIIVREESRITNVSLSVSPLENVYSFDLKSGGVSITVPENPEKRISCAVTAAQAVISSWGGSWTVNTGNSETGVTCRSGIVFVRAKGETVRLLQSDFVIIPDGEKPRK